MRRLRRLRGVGRFAFRFCRGCATKSRWFLRRGSCVANPEDRYDGARQIQYALLAFDLVDVMVEELSTEQYWASEAIHDDETNRVRCVS